MSAFKLKTFLEHCNMSPKVHSMEINFLLFSLFKNQWQNKRCLSSMTCINSELVVFICDVKDSLAAPECTTGETAYKKKKHQ